MIYVIFTPRLSQAMAAALGEALARYALQVDRLELWHIYQDGTRRLDQPLRDTAMQAGAATSAGAGLGCLLAPLAAPIAPLLAGVGLPHLLAWLLAVKRSIRNLQLAPGQPPRRRPARRLRRGAHRVPSCLNPARRLARIPARRVLPTPRLDTHQSSAPPTRALRRSLRAAARRAAPSLAGAAHMLMLRLRLALDRFLSRLLRRPPLRVVRVNGRVRLWRCIIGIGTGHIKTGQE